MGIEYIDKTHARLVVSSGSGSNRIRRVKRITYKGKKDAERQYRDFQLAVSRESNVDISMSVEDLLNWYIQNFEQNGGKPTTVRAYKVSSKPIISFFKGKKARDITLYNIDSFISAESKIRGSKTIRNEVSLLKSSYTFAIRRGLLEDNPCSYAVIPRQVKPQIDILSESDIGRFVDALDTSPLDFKVMCEFALFCGMRRSEIYGLKYSDITDKVRIERVRHHINGKDIIETPKTISSNRVLTVPHFILEDIEELKESHKTRPDQCDFLIRNQWGEPPSSYWCDKYLHKLIKENDLPHITMHGLRHTYASMLINAGIPISDVSHQLGHSSVDITLRIYTHLFKDANEASDRISDLISEKMAPKWHQNKTKDRQNLEIPTVLNGADERIRT